MAYTLVLFGSLVALSQQNTTSAELRDLPQFVAPSGPAASSFISNLLDSILSEPTKTQYKLVFHAEAGGKIVNTTTGFECESECEAVLDEVLRETYTAIPDEDYQFAGWSGDVCNTPATYHSSKCDVTVGWLPILTGANLYISARFSRKANIQSASNTAEFEISNYGFGSFFADEIPPITCYPTIDDCDESGQAIWHEPTAYQAGDFNSDGFQDLLVMPFSNYGFVRETEVTPTIFLNNQAGGLYRSDSIFATGQPVGMQFGYRVAVEDFNGDGRDDFVVGMMGTGSQEPHNFGEFVAERHIVYLSGKDGKLHDGSNGIEGQEDGAVAPGMDLAHDLATGDIDGDGDIDIWMAGRLFENSGLGTFKITTVRQDLDNRPEWPMSSAIADFDGDGIGDLVHAEADVAQSAKVWLYLSGGEPDLSSRQSVPLPVGRFGLENTKHNHMAAADLDGDGDQDIVIGQTRAQPYYQGRELQVLINDGYGNFSDETDARLGDQSQYSTGEAFNQGEGFVHLLDVNADGFIDIFDKRHDAYHPNTAPVYAGASIWLNDGTGSFVDAPPTVFPVVSTSSLAPRYNWGEGRLKPSGPIDINNDGLIDLVSYVTTNPYPSTAFSESTLYSLTAKKKLNAADYAD